MHTFSLLSSFLFAVPLLEWESLYIFAKVLSSLVVVVFVVIVTSLTTVCEL